MPTRSDALGSASLLGRRFPAFIDRYWPKLDDPRIQNRGSDEPDTGQHPGLRCTQGCASTRTGRAYVGVCRHTFTDSDAPALCLR